MLLKKRNRHSPTPYILILQIGYPRNDILYWPNKDEIAKDLRKKLGIPEDKKTILYAPTWRDDEHYGKGEYKFTLALDLKLMMEKLSDTGKEQNR